MKLILLALVSTFALTTAHADDFDWNVAAAEGGIWTVDLGHDLPGQVRAIIGQTRLHGSHMDSAVSLVVNNGQVFPIYRAISDMPLEVRRNGGTIRVTSGAYLSPTDPKPTFATACYSWNGSSYQERSCP